MKKKILLFITFIMMCVCLGGCGNKNDGTAKTITDMGGYEVELPENIERVACGSNPGIDLMIAFGAGDKLAAAHKTVFTNPWFELFYTDAENF